jgi:ABC-2 type transport system ATP-binding protein
MTVLLSSHLMNEVEELCNRVAIIQSGAIVYEGAIAELKRTAGTTYRLHTTDDQKALAICLAQPGITDVAADAAGDGVRFSAAESDAVAQLSGALVEAGVLISAIAPQSATLEDLFFSLTEGTRNGATGTRADGELVRGAA